jgi:salicylate hydroxylase
MNDRLTSSTRKGLSAPDIIVVGAGIGGLTAAVWLASYGCRVRVLEAATELREVGAGVTLGPNATRVLRAGGVLEALASCASRPALQIVQSWDGRILMSNEPNNADSDPAGYLQVHRADLQLALASALEKLAPGALRLGHPVADCEPDASQPKVVLQDGTTMTADLVVGADGVHSTVRGKLFGDEPPTFAGFVAYRGLVPRERLPDLESQAPSGLTIGPGRSFLRYMIRGGDILNFVAFIGTPDWEQEGWSVACERSELENHLAGAHEDVQKVLAAAPGRMLHKWGLFIRQPLERWTRGRVTLLGDAAHPMLPFLGQGASMALEDGCILARTIAETSSLDDALDAYERLRVPRANAIAAASSARAEAIHSGKPEAYTRHVAEDGTSSRENLFVYDATQIELTPRAA